jgi:hypothetical protein
MIAHADGDVTMTRAELDALIHKTARDTVAELHSVIAQHVALNADLAAKLLQWQTRFENLLNRTAGRELH